MEKLIRKRSELADLVKPSQPRRVRFKYLLKNWIINKAIEIVHNGLEEINKKQ